jgi:hypothetical protein
LAVNIRLKEILTWPCSGEILYPGANQNLGRIDGISYHFLTTVEINTLHA